MECEKHVWFAGTASTGRSSGVGVAQKWKSHTVSSALLMIQFASQPGNSDLYVQVPEIATQGIKCYIAPIMLFVYFDSKSLACRFLVIEGSLTRRPSRPLVILTWQPRREVSVRPKARSNMSFSSSSGSSILSYMASSSTMMWQVEHAHEPPQAPMCC